MTVYLDRRPKYSIYEKKLHYILYSIGLRLIPQIILDWSFQPSVSPNAGASGWASKLLFIQSIYFISYLIVNLLMSLSILLLSLGSLSLSLSLENVQDTAYNGLVGGYDMLSACN